MALFLPNNSRDQKLRQNTRSVMKEYTIHKKKIKNLNRVILEVHVFTS